MPKYSLVAQLLARRIANGDYAVRQVPAERQLAKEVNVSYMTARRAVQQLLDEGLLIRYENGRLGVNRNRAKSRRNLQVALLTPPLCGWELDDWRRPILAETAAQGGVVRQICYMHWDDPVLTDALDGFDGCFLYPLNPTAPKNCADRLRHGARKLVVLDSDWSVHGLLSLAMYSQTSITKLLNHLVESGHRTVDCLCLDFPDGRHDYYRDVWDNWSRSQKIAGRLFTAPCDGLASAIEVARATLARELRTRSWNSTALYCPSALIALGAMRALHEAGKVAGKDVAVCSANGHELASSCIPSLTSLAAPDFSSVLRPILSWMASPDLKWEGPVLLHTPECSVEARESTGLTIRPKSS